jgi:hypothetical protein
MFALRQQDKNCVYGAYPYPSKGVGLGFPRTMDFLLIQQINSTADSKISRVSHVITVYKKFNNTIFFSSGIMTRSIIVQLS